MILYRREYLAGGMEFYARDQKNAARIQAR